MRGHAARNHPAARPADTVPGSPFPARRFFLGGLAVGLVAMSAVGLAMVAQIESPGQVAARSAAPPRSVITVPVRWGILRNTIVTAGLVRSAQTISVTAQGRYATLTVTRMPVRPGDRARAGRAVAEIDGRPVLLLRGRLPAYRDLHEGDHGPDVTQLQRDLEGLGYADYDPPGVFGQSTALALLLFYRSLGYRAPVYHPPARSPAHGTAPAASGTSSAPATASPAPSSSPAPTASPAPAASPTPTASPAPAASPTPRSAASLAAAGGPRLARPSAADRNAGLKFPSAYLPRSEVTYIPGRSALVVSVAARLGKIVPAGGVVLTLATGNPSITGTLTAHQKSQVRRGLPARVYSGAPRISAAGTLASIGLASTAGGSPAGRFPIQVIPAHPLSQQLIGTPVRITLRPAVTSSPVLTVPVSAIVAAAHRRPAYVVTVSRQGQRHRILVFTGPTADGMAAVQPVRRGTLRPGDRVVIGPLR